MWYLATIRSFREETEILFRKISYSGNEAAALPSSRLLEKEVFSKSFQTGEGQKFKTFSDFIDFEIEVARKHRIPEGLSDLQMKDSVSTYRDVTLPQEKSQLVSQEVRNLEYLLTTPGIISDKTKDKIYEILEGWYQKNDSISPLLDYQGKVRTEIVSAYHSFKDNPDLKVSVDIICDQLWSGLSKKYASDFSKWPQSISKKYKNILREQLMKVTIVLFVNQSKKLNPNGPIQFLSRSQMEAAVRSGADFSILWQKLYQQTSCFGTGLIVEQLRCLGVNAFYSVPLTDAQGRIEFIHKMAHVRPAIALTGRVFYEIEPECFDPSADFKVSNKKNPYSNSKNKTVYRTPTERTVYKAYFHALVHFLNNLSMVHPHVKEKNLDDPEILDPLSWQILFSKGDRDIAKKNFPDAIANFYQAQKLNSLQIGLYGNIARYFSIWCRDFKPLLPDVISVFNGYVLPTFFHGDHFNVVELLISNGQIDGDSMKTILQDENLDPGKLLERFFETFIFMNKVYERMLQNQVLQPEAYASMAAQLWVASMAAMIQLQNLAKKMKIPFVLDPKIKKMLDHYWQNDLVHAFLTGDSSEIWLSQIIQKLGLDIPGLPKTIADFEKALAGLSRVK